MKINEILTEAVRQRLDAKCWKNKHKAGTKIKGGVRVNNCVPNQGVAEQAVTETAEELQELTQFSKVMADFLAKYYAQYIKNPQTAEYVQQQISQLQLIDYLNRSQPITNGATYRALMPTIGIGSAPGADTYTSPGLELAKKFVSMVVAYFPAPGDADYYGFSEAAAAVYDPRSRTVVINKDYLSDPAYLAGIIAHEVQHGIDDLKSRKGLSVKTDQLDLELSHGDAGKAFKFKQSAGATDNAQKFQSYLAMPHEVNARFTEVINDIKQRIEKEDIQNIGRAGLSELARSAFNQHYMHKVFPNGAKDPGYKRLLSRTYAWLSKYYNDRIDRSGSFNPQPEKPGMFRKAANWLGKAWAGVAEGYDDEDPFELSSDYALHIANAGRLMMTQLANMSKKIQTDSTAAQNANLWNLGDFMHQHYKTDDLNAINQVFEEYGVGGFFKQNLYKLLSNWSSQGPEYVKIWKQYSGDVIKNRTKKPSAQSVHEQGVAEGLDEAVGGNYLYHATGSDINDLKNIIMNGLRTNTGNRERTGSKLRAVSFTRNWRYALTTKDDDNQGSTGINNGVIFVVDQSILKQKNKMQSVDRPANIINELKAILAALPTTTTVMDLMNLLKSSVSNKHLVALSQIAGTPLADWSNPAKLFISAVAKPYLADKTNQQALADAQSKIKQAISYFVKTSAGKSVASAGGSTGSEYEEVILTPLNYVPFRDLGVVGYMINTGVDSAKQQEIRNLFAKAGVKEMPIPNSTTPGKNVTGATSPMIGTIRYQNRPTTDQQGVAEGLYLDEGITDFILKAKDKFLRLKDALSDEWAQSKQMWQIVKKGNKATSREINFANNQFKDILKMVGLAAWYTLPFPGNTLLILATEKLLNQIGMSIMPDKIKNQVLNVKEQGVAEGWKDEADDFTEWSNHVKEKLSKASPEQRLGLAKQLSQLEVKHFGSSIPNTYNRQTGKPQAGLGLTDTVRNALRYFGDEQTGIRRYNNQDLPPGTFGDKFGTVTIDGMENATPAELALMAKAVRAGPDYAKAAGRLYRENGTITQQDLDKIRKGFEDNARRFAASIGAQWDDSHHPTELSPLQQASLARRDQSLAEGMPGVDEKEVTEDMDGTNYTPKVGDEVLWRHSDPRSKMMPMPGTVLAVAPGKVKLKIYSKRMIQDRGTDTVVLDLTQYGITPKQGVAEDWNKVNHHDKTDGLSQKAVNAYRRENPGSKLKTAVTTKPSKLKAGSKDAKRRKSFCARMSGNKGPMKDEHGKPTPKAKALRRWNC